MGGSTVVKLKVAVVGAGIVGQAMKDLCGPETVLFDIKPGFSTDREAVNACDAAFVCVPTPAAADGSCDTSIVEEVVSWVRTPLILLRSTVSPGTTDRLRSAYKKRIVFQPEYLGESPDHFFGSVRHRTFVVLGGEPADTSAAADFYKHFYNSYVQFYFTDALTAELAKYMENAFYAVKVTFVNEFYAIAKAHGVDFNALREIWLADTRISRDHTFVYPDDRGFGGKCLPKDMSAIVKAAKEKGCDARLLEAVFQINAQLRKLNPPR